MAQKCLNEELTSDPLTKTLLSGTDIPNCTDYEVDQFPLRMRDWLKNILMQYYERDQDTTGFLTEKQRHKVSNPFSDYAVTLLEGDEAAPKSHAQNHRMVEV